jgi:hypothetical protein
MVKMVTGNVKLMAPQSELSRLVHVNEESPRVRSAGILDAQEISLTCSSHPLPFHLNSFFFQVFKSIKSKK